jgi:uncharacterized RDD family membrane protein YckC
MEEARLHLAGQSVRVINMIVDMTSLFILWLLLSFGLMLLGFNQTYVDETGEQVPLTPLIIIIPTFWGYYLLTEFLFQRTLGKLLTKTKVVTKNGGKPTFAQILGRTLSRSIPLEYLSYLISVNGVHDRLSGTSVVKE